MIEYGDGPGEEGYCRYGRNRSGSPDLSCRQKSHHRRNYSDDFLGRGCDLARDSGRNDKELSW